MYLCLCVSIKSAPPHLAPCAALVAHATHTILPQAEIPVASCQRQVAQYLVTNDDTDAEIGSYAMFTMQVQQLMQQQQQQQQQQPSTTCSCQPQRPWEHSHSHIPSTSGDNSSSNSDTATTATTILISPPPSSPRHHKPYITGVLITPASPPAAEAEQTQDDASSCSHALAGGVAAEVLATEWEVIAAAVLLGGMCSMYLCSGVHHD